MKKVNGMIIEKNEDVPAGSFGRWVIYDERDDFEYDFALKSDAINWAKENGLRGDIRPVVLWSEVLPLV